MARRSRPVGAGPKATNDMVPAHEAHGLVDLERLTMKDDILRLPTVKILGGFAGKDGRER